MKHRLLILGITIIFILTLLPTAVMAEDTSPADGYNDHDYNAIVNFLSQPSAIAGQTNAQALGYDIMKPETWTDVQWSSGAEKRLVRISCVDAWEGDWNDNRLAGSLDLSNCTALELLFCFDNQLTALDVSGCTALSYLICENNQIPTLDVSTCTKLDSLHCSYNQLATLDVSSNTALRYLVCRGNQLTALDVSANTTLEVLDCHDNQLTAALDVSGFTALRHLDCSHNQLSTLGVSGCAALQYLFCNKNQLKSLDISGCPALQGLDCDKSVKVKGGPRPPTVYGTYDEHDYNAIKNFLDQPSAVPGQTNAKTLGYTADDEITWSHVTWIDPGDGELHVQRIDFSDKSLAGSLNLNKCTKLQDLICNDNQLTTINVNGCTKLEYLDCSNNQLTTLNISGCTKLQALDCTENQLTALDVSGCTALFELYCCNNQLTELDVSRCAALEYLEFDESVTMTRDTPSPTPGGEKYNEHDYSALVNFLNQPSAVPGKTNAQKLGYYAADPSTWSDVDWTDPGDGELYVQAIDFTNESLAGSLDLSDCAELIYLRCDGNQMTSLDVSGCSVLWKLWCSRNQLAALNVGGCTKLEELYCGGNQLTSLDVSGCTVLRILYCSSNQLTSLDLRACTALQDLTCDKSVAVTGFSPSPSPVNSALPSPTTENSAFPSPTTENSALPSPPPEDGALIYLLGGLGLLVLGGGAAAWVLIRSRRKKQASSENSI